MPLNYPKLMAMKFEPVRQTYTRKDTILYALGVGIGVCHPHDAQELKYVYERELVALPMLAVTLGADAMRLDDPELGINYTMVLHAEQSLLVHQPLPVEGTVFSRARIDAIYVKGASKGALMYMTRELLRRFGRSARDPGHSHVSARRWRLRRQERRCAQAAGSACRSTAGPVRDLAGRIESGLGLSARR